MRLHIIFTSSTPTDKLPRKPCVCHHGERRQNNTSLECNLSWTVAGFVTCVWKPQPCLHPNTDCSRAGTDHKTDVCWCALRSLWLCGPAAPKEQINNRFLNSLFFFSSFLVFFWVRLKRGRLSETSNMDHQGPAGGSKVAPSTPAFPVSPPTPYGE